MTTVKSSEVLSASLPLCSPLGEAEGEVDGELTGEPLCELPRDGDISSPLCSSSDGRLSVTKSD